MMNQKNNLSRNDEKLPRLKLLRWVILVVLMVVIYQTIIHFAEPRLLPIRHIKIDAKVERINLDELKSHISSHVKGFFSTNVMALKRKILIEPFIEDVLIKRIWPDTLAITLTELTLVASWGEKAAVSSKGSIIPVKLNPNRHLPVFIGPEGQSERVLEAYTQLSTILRPLNLTIAEIQLNQRSSWQIKLNNGITILLGRKDIETHLNSFIAIFPKLKNLHGDNIESVDLRHSNGMSVHLLNS